MGKNNNKTVKEGIYSILSTPQDFRLALAALTPYLQPHLERKVEARQFSPGAANSIYAAWKKLEVITEKMEEANVDFTELVEWLENAREIRSGVVSPKLD